MTFIEYPSPVTELGDIMRLDRVQRSESDKLSRVTVSSRHWITAKYQLLASLLAFSYLEFRNRILLLRLM
jgi:hypothetical protein